MSREPDLVKVVNWFTTGGVIGMYLRDQEEHNINNNPIPDDVRDLRQSEPQPTEPKIAPTPTVVSPGFPGYDNNRLLNTERKLRGQGKPDPNWHPCSDESLLEIRQELYIRQLRPLPSHKDWNGVDVHPLDTRNGTFPIDLHWAD